jgi:hypothetical protein
MESGNRSAASPAADTADWTSTIGASPLTVSVSEEVADP